VHQRGSIKGKPRKDMNTDANIFYGREIPNINRNNDPILDENLELNNNKICITNLT